MDHARLTGLLTALTEAKAVELREARKLVETSAAHKAQEAIWKSADEGVHAAQKLVDGFIRDQTKDDATELDDEYRQD
jgi:DNA-binding GntR family transcriptional regulator